MKPLPTVTLMYHTLSREPVADPYTLTVDAFETQLRRLLAAGYRLQSVADYLREGRPEMGRILLTFDDGWRSDHELALPLLQKLGVTATFYLTTGRIGQAAQWLDWDQARALRHAGMDVQAHGHTHRLLDDLDGDALRDELELPRDALRRELGVETPRMSCPGGRYNARVLAEAWRAGYAGVATSEPGTTPRRAAGWVWPRMLVRADTVERLTVALEAGDVDPIHRARRRYFIGRLLKRVLGNWLYLRLWMLLTPGQVQESP
jgi:peptidoglycan/xylan/chitin deacetylase (PgdA/CDA1 family)